MATGRHINKYLIVIKFHFRFWVLEFCSKNDISLDRIYSESYAVGVNQNCNDVSPNL